MGNSYTDLCTLGGAAFVVVGDTWFAPQPSWYVRCAAKGGVVCAVCQGPNTVIIKDSTGRTVTYNEPALGAQPVGIEPHEEGWLVEWVMASGMEYAVVVLSDDLVQLSRVNIACPLTSQGMLDIASNGTPIWTDQHRVIQRGPLTIYLPTTRGDWTLGQDGNAYQLVAWNDRTQKPYIVWKGDTQTPSHLTLLDDGTPAALPAMRGAVIYGPTFQPWTPPPLPDFTPAYIRAVADDFPPGTFGRTTPDDYSWGTFRTYQPPTELAHVLADSLARQKPAMGYYDQPPETVDPDAVDARLICGLKCYMRTGMSPVDVAANTETAIKAFAAKGRKPVLWLGLYTGSGVWSLTDVRTTLRLQWDLAITYGLDVVLWGINREPVYPELRDDFYAILAAADNKTPPPYVGPTPDPNLEILMAALTLKRTAFKDGGIFGRKTYPDLTNQANFLSIDSVTLEPRPGGMPGVGASESFTVAGNEARVDFGTHEATFLVRD